MEFKLDESIQKHYGTFVNSTTFLDANGNEIPLIPYTAPVSNGSSSGSDSQGDGDSNSSSSSSSSSSSDNSNGSSNSSSDDSSNSSSSSSDSSSNSSNQSQSGDEGDQGSQNNKVRPDPNKIYRDVRNGKSYKWDDSKNRFVEMKGK